MRNLLLRRATSRPLAAKRSRRAFLSDKTNDTAHTNPPKQAGRLLMRMAPPRGGTERPDATFLGVAAIVCGAGYYAWFVEPPKASDDSSSSSSSSLQDRGSVPSSSSEKKGDDTACGTDK